MFEAGCGAEDLWGRLGKKNVEHKTNGPKGENFGTEDMIEGDI